MENIGREIIDQRTLHWLYRSICCFWGLEYNIYVKGYIRQFLYIPNLSLAADVIEIGKQKHKKKQKQTDNNNNNKKLTFLSLFQLKIWPDHIAVLQNLPNFPMTLVLSFLTFDDV